MSHTRRGSAETALLLVGVAVSLLVAVTLFGRRLAQFQVGSVRALDRGAAEDGNPAGLDFAPGADAGPTLPGPGAGGSVPATRKESRSPGDGLGLPPGARPTGTSPLDGADLGARRGGKGGSGGSGGSGGTDPGAAGGAGGGPTDANPPGPLDDDRSGPSRILQNILQRQRELRARAEKETIPMEEFAWADGAWAELAKTPEYSRLPNERKGLFDTVWRAVKRFERSRTGQIAGYNLARLLEEGKLDGENGLRLLRELARMVTEDEAASRDGRYPLTSDVVLLLGNDARLTHAHRLGGLPALLDAEYRLKVAQEVSRKVRQELSSSNKLGGTLEDARQHARRQFGVLDEPTFGQELLAQRDRTGGDTITGGSDNPDVRRENIRRAYSIGESALDVGLGNCGECAHAAAILLHQRGVAGVELYHKLGVSDSDGVTSGEHAFVVVGRNPNSDPQDPSTWGPNAIIVDPWAGGKAYPAAEWEKLPGKGGFEAKVRLPDPVGAPSSW